MKHAAVAPVLAATLVATLFALFLRTFVVAAAVVASDSMAPTLLAGDRILLNRLVYSRDLPPTLAALLPVRAVAAGDIVWLRSPEEPGLALVKRCAAVEGERWSGSVLAPATLAVEGDSHFGSRDSRAFGPVPRANVRGRVVLVLWSASSDGLRPGRLGRTVR